MRRRADQLEGFGPLPPHSGTAEKRRRRGKGIGAYFICVAVLVSLASAWGKESPPAVPPPQPVTLPSPAVRTLPNGLKVVIFERHSLPILTLRLEVRSGAEADPPHLPGTAQLVAGLLDQGTKRRSALEIAEAVDAAGGTIDAGAGWDESFLMLRVLSDRAEMAFDLLADVALRPAFEAAEVERKRRQALSALRVARADPSYLADAVVRRVAFGGTPYSQPEEGTEEAMEKLTVEDLRAFHARYYRPSNSILAVVGDIKAEEGFARAVESFGAWEDGPSPAPTATGLSWPDTRRIVVIDKPDAVQTEIRIGYPGVPRASSEYYALSAANQVLGGPAENRLFKSLRSRDGLTYGASSDLLCYRALGGWVAKTFTRTPQTVKAVEVALEQIRRLHNDSVTAEELERAKGYLVGHLALAFETSEGVAIEFLDLMLHNLPLDYWNRFPERVRALGPEEVRAASRYLDPERTVIVLVGNAEGFRKDLKKLGPARVIPLQNLDFAAANLERKAVTPGGHWTH